MLLQQTHTVKAVTLNCTQKVPTLIVLENFQDIIKMDVTKGLSLRFLRDFFKVSSIRICGKVS